MMLLVLLSLITYNGLAQVTAAAPPADSISSVKQEQCVVEGSVVNSVSGVPLKNAHLVLHRMDNNSTGNLPAFGAITDSSGRFSIKEIDAGRYSIFITRTGFTYAKQNATPSVLTLEAGRVAKGLSFKLVPQAVITGRVVDEDNEPAANASISCMRYHYVSGTKVLRNSGGTSTNDKGEFRMFGLEAGKCYISARWQQNNFEPNEIRKSSGNDQGYITTYYPSGASPSSAIAVNLSPGGEVGGIDIRLMRAKTVNVSGTITNLPKLTNAVTVLLVARDGNGWLSERQNAGPDPKGHFVIHDVAPGAYTLIAMDWQETAPRTATALLEVGDSHVEGVHLTLGMDPDMKGKLITEGAPAPAAAAASAITPQRVGLQSDDGMMFAIQDGSVKEDGTFVLKNLWPSRYRLNVWPMPAGAYLKQVQLGEQDVRGGVIDLRSGIDARELTITVSLNGAQVEGVVHDKDQPYANATVGLIPSDSMLRNYYAIATSDQNGHYVFRGVAPGKYQLYAFDQIENGAYLDPDFLKPYEDRGEAFEFAEGARETCDLKLIRNDEDSGSTQTGKEP